MRGFQALERGRLAYATNGSQGRNSLSKCTRASAHGHTHVAADVSRRHLCGGKNAPTDVGGYSSCGFLNAPWRAEYPSGGCFGHGISGDAIVGAYYNDSGLHGFVATPRPRLAISASGANQTISWPYSPFVNWTLEQNPDLSETNWMPSGSSVSNDGTNNSITLGSPAGNLFFRLRQQ